MTVDDARKFLKGSRKDVKLDALEVVSLSEKELFVIQLRYITGLTQEKAADRLPLLYAVVRIIKEEHAKGTKIPEGMEKAYDEIHKDKMKDVLRIRMQLDEYKK